MSSGWEYLKIQLALKGLILLSLSCALGYFGEPAIAGGNCSLCQCNNNSDVCHRTTGHCFNCKYNTTGPRCERCENGTYGDATKQQCQSKFSIAKIQENKLTHNWFNNQLLNDVFKNTLEVRGGVGKAHSSTLFHLSSVRSCNSNDGI